MQKEQKNLIKILLKSFILEKRNFESKLEAFTKLKKRFPLALVLLVMKITKNIQSTYEKKIVKKNMLINH